MKIDLLFSDAHRHPLERAHPGAFFAALAQRCFLAGATGIETGIAYAPDYPRGRLVIGTFWPDELGQSPDGVLALLSDARTRLVPDMLAQAPGVLLRDSVDYASDRPGRLGALAYVAFAD